MELHAKIEGEQIEWQDKTDIQSDQEHQNLPFG